jgi:hypothetical protein
MAPSVPFRALLSVITTSNNSELSSQRLRRIEVPALDGPHADIAANARSSDGEIDRIRRQVSIVFRRQVEAATRVNLI